MNLSKLKILSIVLFILSIIIPIIAFYIVCLVGNVWVFGIAGMSYSWIFLFFLPIPLASIALGIYSKKKHTKYLKNIVTGSISFSLMFIIGLTSFRFKVDKTGSFLKDVETVTGIAMPTNVRAMSMIEYGGRLGNAEIKDKAEETTFLEEIKTNRWTNELTVVCKGMLPLAISSTLSGYSRLSIYVPVVNEFNPKTLNVGEYEIVLLAYEKARSHIMVFDSYVASIK